jgi:hypothetical protein
LQSVANANPQFASISSIGKTFEGRELAMLKASEIPNGIISPQIDLFSAGLCFTKWYSKANVPAGCGNSCPGMDCPSRGFACHQRGKSML